MPQETTPSTVHLRFHGYGREDEDVAVAPGTTYEDLLRERGIHPETCLVFCNDEVVPAQAEVEGDAEVRILHIVSGGG